MSASSLEDELYGEVLARVHHEHFGVTARAAATELFARLAAAGHRRGLVADLAAGSGILSRSLADAGYDVAGVDTSEPMLRLARAEAPSATFTRGSLWRAPLQPCVAVAAVGEALCYATDPLAGPSGLEAFLRAVHRALLPGGVLLFDVAGPGRSGPSGVRRSYWQAGDVHLGLVEEEEPARGRLTRTLSLFVPEGAGYRRVPERHELWLYPHAVVQGALDAAGFRWERLDRYGALALLPGWYAYAAVRPGASV